MTFKSAHLCDVGYREMMTLCHYSSFTSQSHTIYDQSKPYSIMWTP